MERPITDTAYDIACEAARKARDIHRDIASKELSIRKKQGFDIVTEADTQAEYAIVEHLKATFPDHTFSSEELNESQQDSKSAVEWRWIIDPLDGTINYANGIPLFSVSLALQHFGDTILGVIYDTSLNILYTAKKGFGAFKDNYPIQVSDEKLLENSVLTFMLTSHYSVSQTKLILQIIERLSSKTRGLRLWVSQALELAFIAEGKLQGTVCIKSRGFSAAAGVLLIQEAGGCVSDLSGQSFGNSSRSIVATNSLIHEDVLRLIEI